MIASAAAVRLAAAQVPPLDEWVSSLGDADYQATSRAHVALGRRPEGGVLTVEHFPGVVVLNRHLRVNASPDRLVMVSPRSTAYVLGLLPVALSVTWRMEASRDGDRVDVAGTLEVALRRRAHELAARLVGLRRLLAAHAREELDGFAADMARKASPAPEPACPAAAGARA